MGEMIRFKRPDGKDCAAYEAQPQNAKGAPGVVVLQEWWGLNDQIKGVADRLAGLGYRALVPDLYRGKVTVEAAEANHLMTSLDFGDAATQDIRGAAQHLKKSCPRVGVTGFCMGGALTVLSAVHVKELDAASSWYGFPPEGAADVRTIPVPIQLHLSSKDAYFTPDAGRKVEARMKEGGVKVETFWYDADHAFGNEKSPAYDKAAAEQAWKRTLDLFGRHLKA